MNITKLLLIFIAVVIVLTLLAFYESRSQAIIKIDNHKVDTVPNVPSFSPDGLDHKE